MAKGAGNSYWLWIESSTPGTFSPVKGQKNLKRTGSSEKSESTTKDTTGTKTYMFGLSDTGWTLDVIPDLPDANGYTRLESQTLASPKAPFNIQVRKAGAAATSADAIWAGSVYSTITGGDFDQGSAPVQISFEFTPAASPTADALAI